MGVAMAAWRLGCAPLEDGEPVGLSPRPARLLGVRPAAPGASAPVELIGAGAAAVQAVTMPVQVLFLATCFSQDAGSAERALWQVSPQVAFVFRLHVARPSGSNWALVRFLVHGNSEWNSVVDAFSFAAAIAAALHTLYSAVIWSLMNVPTACCERHALTVGLYQDAWHFVEQNDLSPCAAVRKQFPPHEAGELARQNCASHRLVTCVVAVSAELSARSTASASASQRPNLDGGRDPAERRGGGGAGRD